MLRYCSLSNAVKSLTSSKLYNFIEPPSSFHFWKPKTLFIPVTRFVTIRLSSYSTTTRVHCIFDEDKTNTCQYIAWDQKTNEACIIDPVMDFDVNTGKVSFDNADKLLAFVASNSLNVKYILETHVHADHLTSSAYLKMKLPSNPPTCIGAGIVKVQETFKVKYGLSDSEFATDGSQFDMLLKDQQSLPLGSLEIKCMETPGHTPDHIAYLVQDAVFVGDTLFLPDVGSARCDFPNGSSNLLYESVQNKLFKLDTNTKVYVGHDYPPKTRPNEQPGWVTPLSEQINSNIHLKQGTTKEQFMEMRDKRDNTLSAPKLLHFSLQVNMRAGRLGGGNTLLVKFPISSPCSL